ncbi:MAG: EAL domain-containing protein [Methylophilaceae bacterium]
MYIASSFSNQSRIWSFRNIVRIILLAVVYWVTGNIDQFFSLPNLWANFFYPPTGIALAALLIYGYRIWPGILLGSSIACWTAGASILAVIGISFGNTVEALFAYYLLKQFAKFDPSLSRLRDLFALTFFAVAVSPLVGNLISESMLDMARVAGNAEISNMLGNSWMSDALSYLLLTPAILAIYYHQPIKWNKYKVVEALVLSAFIIMMSMLAMLHVWRLPTDFLVKPKTFMFFTLVVWAALSFHQRGVALATMTIILTGLWGGTNAAGYFAADFAKGNLVNYWLFSLVLSITGFTISGLTAGRIKSEARLKEQLSLYDALSRAQSDVSEGVLILQDGKIVYGNDAVWRVAGYAPGDFAVGADFFGLIHPSDRQRVAEMHRKRIQGLPVPNRYEAVGLTKNGQPVPIEIAAAMVPDGSGRVVVLIIDISERQKSVAALTQSREDYRELVESIQAIVWRATPGGSFTFVSKEAETLMGYPLSDWTEIPTFWADKIHPDDREWVVDYCIQESIKLNSHVFDYRMIAADGRIVWMQDIVRVIPNRHGKPQELVGVMLDITARKKAEASLHLSHQVFEHTAEGIVITDADFNVLEVNQAYEQITGYARDEITGKPPMVLSTGLHDQAYYDAVWQTIQDEGQWIGEIWNRRKDGESYPEWLSISKVLDSKGLVQNYVAVFTDITQRKLSEERLQFIANHDALTLLPNRALLQQRIEQALVRAQRHNEKIAVLFIDLDRFKIINDTLGHHAGDLLLQEAAKRLTDCLRESDTVARQGGDEFVVLIEDFTDTQYLTTIARKIMSVLAQPFILLNQELHISASIGITIYPEDGADVFSLLKNADVAMYRAKESGKNTFHFYAAESNLHSVELLELENGLRRALERNEFVLHYQAKIDLKTQQVIGAEALLRWQHPELGLLSPIHFISLAEETGLIIDIGTWVLRDACKQAVTWQDFMPDDHPIRVAVNLSARQFREETLKATIEDALAESGLPAPCLELEITESMIMQNAERASSVLQYFRDLGTHVLIDDFGTGYSSLSYLKQFPIDALKIDRSFVRDIPKDSDDMAITKAIIAMAHSLNMLVVAEGVETGEQLKFLQTQHCDQIQGYIFSEPVSAESFVDLLRGVNVAKRLHTKMVQDA